MYSTLCIYSYGRVDRCTLLPSINDLVLANPTAKPTLYQRRKYYTFENKEVERKFGLKHLDLRPKQFAS